MLYSVSRVAVSINTPAGWRLVITQYDESFFHHDCQQIYRKCKHVATFGCINVKRYPERVLFTGSSRPQSAVSDPGDAKPGHLRTGYLYGSFTMLGSLWRQALRAGVRRALSVRTTE
jgi:hypothetical protein